MRAIHDLIGNSTAVAPPEDIIDSALETVRRHLGMSVAYLSEFVEDRIVFRAVSAPGLEALIKPGDSHLQENVFCRRILDGRLPELIRDTHDYPEAMNVPIMAAVPIRSHVSVPIRLADGSVFGMFCCLDMTPNYTLNLRDLEVMHLFATLSAGQVNRALGTRRRRDTLTGAIRHILDTSDYAVALQPIRSISDLSLSGFEALCRFAPLPYRPPNEWFAEADEVGLGPALEIAVASRALDSLDSLPDNVFVSVNASPATVASGLLTPLLSCHDPRRIVLEVTEHAAVTDNGQIAAAIAPFRKDGLLLAVDDAGAGYAGLQHILQLRPDIIKLDMCLTRHIDADAARRSLASALVRFASETGALLVAEGIETEAELLTLRALGVQLGQGYLLGRPFTLGDAMVLTTQNSADPARAIGSAAQA